MTITNRDAPESRMGASRQSSQDWLARLQQLSDTLMHCPTDIATRCELAILLEDLGQYEEALVNWKAVLISEPNNLGAHEGSARCRQWLGRSLQFPPEGI